MERVTALADKDAGGIASFEMSPDIGAAGSFSWSCCDHKETSKSAFQRGDARLRISVWDRCLLIMIEWD